MDSPEITSQTTCASLLPGVDMQDYPSVNWWKGNLRLHESYLSLVVRFSHLNGIKIGEACTFLDGLLGNLVKPAEADLISLARALNDDLQVVQTVVWESIKLTPCPGSTILTEKTDGSVRYCEECAAMGYHSYLHEYRWLARCPLHDTCLKIMSANTRTGSLFVRTGKALAQVMAAASPTWPAAQPAFRPDAFKGLNWLSRWTAGGGAKANNMAERIIWSSDTAIFRERDGFDKVIGQLHALEPIPEAMRMMFGGIEDDWSVDVQHFSSAAKDELSRVYPFGFSLDVFPLQEADCIRFRTQSLCRGGRVVSGRP